LVTADGADIGVKRILAPAGPRWRGVPAYGCGLEMPRGVPAAMVIIGAQCWRHTMIVPPECMLSVDVEGWKGHSAGCGSAAAVEPLAWRCMTSTAGSSLMDGRAEAPALPKASVYLPVEDLPPKREKPAMTADERSKLQKELIAVRDRQASDGKARGGAARRPQPIKP
jgi:hypothetical protein